MKTNHRIWNLILSLLLPLLLAVPAYAGDRVLEVQSRVNAALSSILPKTDFMVTVNRIDAMDSSLGSEASNGAVRPLPGLRVGVDEKGQVVVKDSDVSSYDGPVSLTVLLDSGLKEETVKTIEKFIPEIMGGAQNADEIKLTRAVLRQPLRSDEKPAPQVVIQNMIDDKAAATQEAQRLDTYKLLAVFLVGLGALMWLASRSGGSNKRDPAPTTHPLLRDNGPLESAAQAKSEMAPELFEDFDPKIVALFLKKCMHENKPEKALSVFTLSSPKTQRGVLSTMPAWLSAYFLEQFESLKANKTKGNPEQADSIMREIVVLDKAISSHEQFYATNFIQWLPEKALTFVSSRSVMNVSPNVSLVLAFVRPDLASQLPFDENLLLSNAKDLKPEMYVETYNEMMTWSAKMVDPRKRPPSIVDTMTRVLRGLNTIEEVEAKLQSVQTKMKPNDFELLKKRTACLDTIKGMNEEQQKEFLRQVNPNDFYFLTSFEGIDFSTWPLEKLMRPIRLRSFQIASQEAIYKSWSPAEKSKASRRLLTLLRTTISGEKDDLARAA